MLITGQRILGENIVSIVTDRPTEWYPSQTPIFYIPITVTKAY